MRLNHGTAFSLPVGVGSAGDSSMVDIWVGATETSSEATAFISLHRLRLMAGGCSGIADLAFFWRGLFTGVKEEAGGGSSSDFTRGPLLVRGAPPSFFRGATEATEGIEADVLAGVAIGLSGLAPNTMVLERQSLFLD